MLRAKTEQQLCNRMWCHKSVDHRYTKQVLGAIGVVGPPPLCCKFFWAFSVVLVVCRDSFQGSSSSYSSSERRVVWRKPWEQGKPTRREVAGRNAGGTSKKNETHEIVHWSSKIRKILRNLLPFVPINVACMNRRFMSQARRTRHFARSAKRVRRAKWVWSARRGLNRCVACF